MANVLHMPKTEFDYYSEKTLYINLQYLVLKPPYKFLFGF